MSMPKPLHIGIVAKTRDHFLAVSDEGILLGCGALKELDAEHGEVKSMRAPQSLRRRGAGRSEQRVHDTCALTPTR